MNNPNGKAVQVLNDVVAVNLQFSIWTGRKKLSENDLSLRGETPPKEVINLGSKHTTDPKALKVFNTLKRQAERKCLSVGIPFLGGYAIPSKEADNIALELAKIVARFEAEKAAYLIKHETIQKDWIENYPAYETILMKALTPVSEVENRISANFSMFKVQSAQSSVTSADVGLGSQVDSLSDNLDTDILKTSKKLLESLSSAIHPNRVNVNGLVSLREKVEGLAFLNSKFFVLVDEIRKVERHMPVAGKLSGDEVNLLSGLLFRMADKSKLEVLMTNLNQDKDLSTGSTIDSEALSFMPSEPAPTFDSDDFEFDFGDSDQSQHPNNHDDNPALGSVFF